MTLSHLILSDSGGMQEEAPALGVPLLVLRENSERPEAIACGNARLVGTDPAAILAAATRLLDDPAAHAAMARPAFPYGRRRRRRAHPRRDRGLACRPVARHGPSTLAIAAPLAHGSAAKGRE